MNTLPLAGKVCVLTTNDDSGMATILLVQTDEVAPIDGHDSPTVGSSEVQHFGIGHPFAGPTDVARSQNIVPQPPQHVDDWLRKVFVRVQARQSQASSFSRICRSISALWARTKAQALARSSARRDG